MDPFLPTDRRVAAIRELLPATAAGIYLDTATAGPVPAEMDRALREADDWELRVGRGGPDRAGDAVVRREEARAVVAAVLGATTDRVVLSHGVAGSLMALIADLPAGATGRLVVVDGIDEPAIGAARLAAGGRGLWLERVAAAVPHVQPGTAMVVAPWVHPLTGQVADIPELARRSRAVGARLVVDASHAVGAVPLTVRGDAGADAVLLDGHRWLLGPEGTGASWLSPALGPAAPARLAAALDPLPRRAALGLARSVGWLLMYVGLAWVLERTAALAARLHDGLASIDGLELLTPAPPAASVAFRVRGWRGDQVADELGRRVFAILGRLPGQDGLRASVGAWNTEAELDRLVAATAELAAHTPATLPRRAALVVFPSAAERPGDPGA